MSRQRGNRRSAPRPAMSIVDIAEHRRTVTEEVAKQLSKGPQRRKKLHGRRATLQPVKLPLERAARCNPAVATPAMFGLERELAAHADGAYRGKPTNAATLPPGDLPDFGPDIKLGDAIAQYAQDESLTVGAAYARYAGELAELVLEALAAKGKPLRDAIVYLARAGHMAEAGALWNALRAADRQIARHEAKHNRQDESYKASHTWSDKAEPLRESVKSALKKLVDARPNLRASEYARLLLRDPYKRHLRRVAGRVPSERDLRRKVSQLLPELSKR